MRANVGSSGLKFLAVFLLLGSPLAAQDAPATEESGGGFHFEIDPLVIGYESVDVDTDSAKFNEYRDFDDGFLLEELRMLGTMSGGDRSLSFEATRADRHDAFYALDYRVEGSYDVELEMNRIPHNFLNNGHTIFDWTGGGRWEVADSTQAALQAQIAAQYVRNRNGVNFAFLDGLLQPYFATANVIDVGLQRDRSRASVDMGKGGAMGWGLDFEYEKRTGGRPIGGTFGFNSVAELPEPIDYRTSAGQLSGEWKGERGGVQFGGRVSQFENENDTMVFDNPFRLTSSTDSGAYQAPGSSSIAGSALGRVDLAPDNDALTLFVNGRGKFGSWTTTGALSWVRMTQDDQLQPYTLNTAIDGIDEHGATFDATDASFLPQSSADREVDVLSFSGSAGVPIGESWELDLRARYYDYDNGSDTIVFPGYVRYHGVWEEIGRKTAAYAYDRTDLSADLGWNPARGTRFGFVAGLRDMNRSFREIESSDEIFGRLDASSRLGGFWLHGHLEYGERSTDNYHVEAQHDTFTHPEAVNNQPALRKYDEAEREFADWLLQADWAISDVLDLSFGYSGRIEDYDKSRFGLVSDDVDRWNAEVNWRVAEAGNVYLFYQLSDREVVQRSRQSAATPSVNPLDDWNVTFDEANDVAGLGVNFEFAERFTLDVSGRYSKSDGAADIYSPPGGTPNLAVGFDDYEDIELFEAVVDLGFDITDRFGVGFGWRYEDYITESFITRGLDYYLPGAMLLNGENGDYQGDVYTLRFVLHY
jgi:MtrB/PioB family decaheme-associated outer membrane protein